jgi:hypothetical protein
MNNPKAQKILNSLLKEVGGEWKPESVCDQLTQLRTIALEMNDPLIVKTLRLMREKIQENESFEVEIEVLDEEDEFEEPENHLEYLLNLLLESDNKYNREEIKLYRTALMKELY